MTPSTPHPPRWAERLLRHAVPGDPLGRGVAADLLQEFLEMAERRSPSVARRWYAWEALKIAAHFTFERARPYRRAGGGRASMGGLAASVRLAFRRLRRSPGFAVVAVGTMALGIGSTVAIFSVVDTVLLEPLPYRDADRLVALWEWNLQSGNRTNVVNPGNFADWRDRSATFEDMGAVGIAQPVSVREGGQAREVVGQWAQPGWFRVLGLQPALGRSFTPLDGSDGGTEVILSDGYWREHYGADPAVLGRTLQINDRTAVVVGVLPPDYVLHGDGVDLWAGVDLTRGDQTNTGRWMFVVGRLAGGSTLEAARAELEGVAAGLREEHPRFNAGWSVTLVPLQEQVVGDIRRGLWLLLGAVGLLLLIACANVANLFLVRATERQQEMAVRTSLGATGRGLATQLLVESLVVAGLGAAVGVGLAHVGTRALATRVPDAFALPRVEHAGVNAEVLVFAVGLTVLTGLLFGLLPALQAWGASPSATLASEGRGASRRTGRVRDALVVAEVGLSLVLLTGAVLFSRSFVELASVDTGVRADSVMVARVNLAGTAYPDEATRIAFFDRLMPAIGARRDVRAVGGVSFLPMDGMGSATGYWPADRPEPADEEKPTAHVRNVTPGYFDAVGIRLLQGRLFDEHDRADEPQRVVVNRSLAEAEWPGRSAVGERLIIQWRDAEPWEVIGVVDDVHMDGPGVDAGRTVYLAYAQEASFPWLQLAVRATDPDAAGSIVREEVARLDPGLPVSDVRRMERIVARAMARPRMTTFLLLLFGAVATVLTAVGLYGVLAYGVSRRTREIGVRMAVGAHRRDVLSMIAREGARTVGLGLGIGAALALMAGRLVAGALYGIVSWDPVALGSAAVFLLVVAAVASALPAWRATRIAPHSALRSG